MVSKVIFREQLNLYRLGSVVFIEDHAAGDANGARHILVSNMYRRFLRELDLPPNLSLVDLGSSNGGFPLLLKNLGFTIGRIVAVEMNPATFKRMRFNIELNFDCNLHLLNAAVGDREGIIKLSLSQGSTGDSLFRNYARGVPVEVPMITLDALIGDRFIDLLKMDIEGAEYLVCRSRTGTAFARCKYVLAEIHRAYGDPHEVVKYLMDQGLQRLNIDSQNCESVYCFVNPYLNRQPPDSSANDRDVFS